MTKEKFIGIITQLKAAEELQHKVAVAVRQYNNLIHCDYPDPYGLVVSHGFLVTDLLSEIMNDDDRYIELFCYELDFGRKYYSGCITEDDGTEIDISDAEKLWDYLNKNKTKDKE